MPINVRPPGSSGPMYNPERDIAYIAPTLLRAAITSLDPDRILPSLRAYMDEHGVTDQDLSATIAAVAGAQSLFVGTLDVKTPLDALEASGFTAQSPAAQGVVLAAFGRVLLGAWFKAVREVTHVEDAPECQEDISRYYFAALGAAARLRDEEPPPFPDDPRLQPAVLSEQLRLLRSYHSEMLQRLKTERKRHASLSAELIECRTQLHSLWTYRLRQAIKRLWAKLRGKA